MIQNDQYLGGMSASIVAAVEQEPDAAFYAMWPGDMPALRTDTALRVIAAARPGRIVLPTVDQQRGHPVVFSRTFRNDLLLLRGDTGARSILERYPEAVDEIPVSDPGILLDIDTKDDLQDIASSSS